MPTHLMALPASVSPTEHADAQMPEKPFAIEMLALGLCAWLNFECRSQHFPDEM